ncbi:MAG: helix-turn-helix domain-containing protein [Pseudonocardia sp.]|nr:helix-turn-helix domain-containing protein [Pseudonocardia sp.]
MSGNSVTDEAVPSNDPVDGMGRRIAAYRTQRGLRVSDLARSVGVSPSLVSQIERGQSRPSVSTLFAVAETLGLPVDAFFREQPAPASHVEPRAAQADPYLVRRAERVGIDIEGGVRWERLTPTTLRDVEFMELVYGPGAQSSPTLYRHPGTEMIVILSGRLDIHLGFESYHLGPGDSMHFSSALPHRYVNPTQETTRAVTTILRDEARHETRDLPPE